MARSRAHLRLVPDPPVTAPPTRPAAPASSPPPRSPGPEPLWRELLGAQFRARRLHRGERLADVAGRAGVSPQYLSEVERGRKEPSSEMIGAIGRALGTDLAGLAQGVGRDLQRRTGTPAGTPSTTPSGPTALLRVA
ncbi:helix-turn-helix transcriptional regulator [Nakamurella flava]|uniref:Helix-turn-helix transcriptional regulator n=1 Tax=Nakamurella flava TaxID=2576308 RepID=A0A4U6QEG1_9ACTN|nr:helix-turn-helix transcriptional regulator [Nakamurella flava]TKV58372.1 helix-turn-helix transcriptional regulator [Nakamurella flava]